MTLGQRVAVMDEGEFQQVAPPMEVYRRPANRFVAGFVGSPAMNFLACSVDGGDGRAALACEGFRIGLDEPPGAEPGAPLTLGVRPHDVEIVAENGGEPGRGGPVTSGESARVEPDVHGRVDVLEPLGAEILVHLRVAGHGEGLRAIVPPETPVAVDAEVGIRFRRDRLHLFEEASGRRLG